MLDAVTLQCAEVVSVTEFGAQLFEERPIVLGASGADFALEVAFEVGGNAVVVEQRVVHVEQENNFVGAHRIHRMLSESALMANDFSHYKSIQSGSTSGAEVKDGGRLDC